MAAERDALDPTEPPRLPTVPGSRPVADPGGRRRVLLPYLIGLLVSQALLVVLYLLLPHTDFVDLDKEYNLPSLFSTLQLAAIGVASFFAFEAERRGPARRAPLVWAWPLIGLGFFYLAADEMLAIHEGVLTDVVRHVLPADSLIQAVMPWEMVFAPGILGAFIMISAMGYTRLGARRPLLAAALTGLALWAASFVLEGAAKPFFIPRGLYRLEVGLEESAEMLGETLLLAAFASYALAAAREEIMPLEVVPWRPLLGTAGGPSPFRPRRRSGRTAWAPRGSRGARWMMRSRPTRWRSGSTRPTAVRTTTSDWHSSRAGTSPGPKGISAWRSRTVESWRTRI